MANYITTLKDDNGTNNLLPKTVLKAVADDNGNYLDNGLAASDINKLKGGEIVKLEENLARIETSPTTHAYSVGERLVYNGILYRVKAAISIGDDLVVDTNIEKKSVDDALSDIIKQKHLTGTTATYGLVTTDIPLSKKIVCINSGQGNLVCVPYNAVDHWNIMCRNCVTWNGEAGVSYDMYIYYIA